MSQFKVGDRAALKPGLIEGYDHAKGTVTQAFGPNSFHWRADGRAEILGVAGKYLYKISDVPPVPVENPSEQTKEIWRAIDLLQAQLDEVKAGQPAEAKQEAPLPPVQAPSRQPAQGEVWRSDVSIDYAVVRLAYSSDLYWLDLDTGTIFKKAESSELGLSPIAPSLAAYYAGKL